MNTSRLIKILATLVITSLASGCKLEIVAVQGGDVAWSGGSCSEGSNCIVEITDPNFTNSFTVTPKPGYEFVKWQKGAGFLCGDSTSPTCTFTMPADANVAAVIIGVFATGYMMPVYKDVGVDTDGDTIRNELDPDDDGDLVLDINDPCPLNPNSDCSLHVADPDTVYVPDSSIEIDNAFTGVTLSTNVSNGHVLSLGSGVPEVPGWEPSVFGHGLINFPTGGCSGCWSFGYAELRADFSEPSRFVRVDFIDRFAGTAKLKAYSSTGVLLGVSTMPLVGHAAIDATRVSVEFFDPSGSISYVLAGGDTAVYGVIDKLVWY